MALRWRHRVASAVAGRAAAAAGTLYAHLPASLARASTGAGGDVGRLLSPRRAAAIDTNLRWLRPDADADERRALVGRTFRNFARCAADVMALPATQATHWRHLARIDGLANLDNALAGGRGVVMVCGHLGNWELGVYLLGALGYPAAALVESISPERDALMARYRGRTGVHLLPSTTRLSHLIGRLDSGGVLAVVADRCVGRTQGMVVPFASGYRPVPRGPAWLATRTGAPLVPVRINLSDRTEQPYHAVVEPPINIQAGASVDDVTRRIGARLAAQAAAYPDQWFVFDARWCLTP